jgi:hypothetical protein
VTVRDESILSRKSSRALSASRSDARRLAIGTSNAECPRRDRLVGVLEIRGRALEGREVALERRITAISASGARMPTPRSAKSDEMRISRPALAVALSTTSRGVAQREVAHGEVEVVLDRDAGHVFARLLDAPFVRLGAVRGLDPRRGTSLATRSRSVL